MHYGIGNLSVVALRLEPSEEAKMTNQLLFGECFTILEKNEYWSKIQLHFDHFEGYINNKQFEEIPEEIYKELSQQKNYYCGEFVDFISNQKNELTTITIGSALPFYNNKNLQINHHKWMFEGDVLSEKLPKSSIIEKASLFLNTPYLHGGKTPFGIDDAAFTQLIYKLCGYQLYRKASNQASQGEVLSFIEESEPGDLAFFDDDEGEITHVGIILNDYKIIHAYGKVRIDFLDHSGIYNIDTQKHTHKLRVIKKII